MLVSFRKIYAGDITYTLDLRSAIFFSFNRIIRMFLSLHLFGSFSHWIFCSLSFQEYFVRLISSQGLFISLVDAIFQKSLVSLVWTILLMKSYYGSWFDWSCEFLNWFCKMFCNVSSALVLSRCQKYFKSLFLGISPNSFFCCVVLNRNLLYTLPIIEVKADDCFRLESILIYLHYTHLKWSEILFIFIG